MPVQVQEVGKKMVMACNGGVGSTGRRWTHKSARGIRCYHHAHPQAGHICQTIGDPHVQDKAEVPVMRDFDYTVKHWREDPEGLKSYIMAHLKRAAEYLKELKEKDLMSFEIDELVYHFISPPDVPCRQVPDGKVYDQIIDWAMEVA